MNSLTLERILPRDIDILKPHLTELQQKILTLKSIEGSDADITNLLSIDKGRLRYELRRVRRLFLLCKNNFKNLRTLKKTLLEAPIEILHLSDRFQEALLDSKLNCIADFYKQKVTEASLSRLPLICDEDAGELNEALQRVDLPKLDEREAKSAIYGFFDVDKRSRLTQRHILLLREWTWGRAAKQAVADRISLDPGYFDQLQAHLLRRLRGEPISVS